MIRLSNSKLENYFKCPHKYKLQYIDKVKGTEIKATTFEVGNFIHKVLETYREGLDLNEICALHRPNYVLSDFDDAIIDKMIVKAVEYYQPYIGCAFDSELWLTSVVDSALTLIGIIDKIYYHHPDNPKDGKFLVSVIDYKTGKRKYDNSQQLKFYNALIYKELGIPPEKVENKVFYLRLEENIEYSFDLGDINEFITYVGMISECMEKRERFDYKTGWHCKWCQYNDGTCTYYTKVQEQENNR